MWREDYLIPTISKDGAGLIAKPSNADRTLDCKKKRSTENERPNYSSTRYLALLPRSDPRHGLPGRSGLVPPADGSLMCTMGLQKGKRPKEDYSSKR